MKHIIRDLLLISGVSAAVCLGGCTYLASSGNGAETGDKSTEPVKIGMIAPVTGEKAEFGKSMWMSIEMAVDEVNAAGGVLGRQVELVTMDSKAQPKAAVEAAEALVQDDSIVAVLGPMMSGEAIACAPVFEDAGIIELAPVANHPDYAAMGDYMFTMAASQIEEYPAMVEKQIKGFHHADSVGVLYVATDYGVSCYNQFEASCKEQSVQITDAESFLDLEKDFTNLLLKVRQTNPQLLVIVSQQIECAAILKQVKELGWDIPIAVISTNYSDQTLQLAGDATEGITSITAFFVSEDDPAVWEYAQKFEERAGYEPTVHGILSYDAAGVLCDAINRAGSTDRRQVLEALKATDGWKGLAGEYRFTPDGYVRRNFEVLQVVDGEWVPQ